MSLTEVYQRAGVLPQGNGPKFSTEDVYILELLKNLSPDRKAMALEFIEFLRTRDD